MHNGRYATLDEVVDFHDRGGGAGSELHPLGLSAHERQALVAFLRTLSGPLQQVDVPPAYDYGTVAGDRRCKSMDLRPCSPPWWLRALPLPGRCR
jgi:hypothetical protein